MGEGGAREEGEEGGPENYKSRGGERELRNEIREKMK
jgi:hypothetical protein